MPTILSGAFPLPETPKGEKRGTYLKERRLFNGMMRRVKKVSNVPAGMINDKMLGGAFPLPKKPKR